MAGTFVQDDELYKYLDNLPSSELGPVAENFSDNGGWGSKASLDKQAVREGNALISNIDSEEISIDATSDESVSVSSTSKRARKTENKATSPKNK